MKSTVIVAFFALAAVACSSQTPTEPTGTASQDIRPFCFPIQPPTPFIDDAELVGAATIHFTGEMFTHQTCRAFPGGDTVAVSLGIHGAPPLTPPLQTVTVTSLAEGDVGTISGSLTVGCDPTREIEYAITAYDETTSTQASAAGDAGIEFVVDVPPCRHLP